MIARIWHGVVPQKKAECYYDYLKTTGIQDYRNTEGNIGMQVFRKQENELAHYLLITYWDSYESIKKFAGEEYEKARYYPEDEEFLLELEPSVDHYEMLEEKTSHQSAGGIFRYSYKIFSFENLALLK